MESIIKYGIALGGGGAKGAYEIGTWKALREMKIPLDVVVGASVGALNGAMIVQDDFDLACKLWENLKMENIINIWQEAKDREYQKISLGAMINIIRNSILSGGMDVTPLKKLIYDVIDEEKIRSSKIDFGIVTFSLTDFKAVKLFKEDIPKGKLADYLLASSCFPTFQPQIIDKKRFIDGGVYDNIPISLLLEKCDHIITVDVSGPGRIKKVDISKHDVITIKNSQYLGGTLQFEKENSKVNMEYGYYDTLKAFNKISGKKYFLIKTNIERDYKIEKREIEAIYNYFNFHSSDIKSKNIEVIKYKLLKTIRSYTVGEFNSHSTFIAMAEICAETLGINKLKLYTLEQLIKQIMDEYANFEKGFINAITNINKYLVFFNPSITTFEMDTINKRKLMALGQTKVCIGNIFISLIVNLKF